ncbi:hypothetical protein TREES_T100008848 [Tupaia chinensis]|uniref:Uncharacterized protein n=1 Tax=Tupaia chinensis TaxID=246437 RepID=L9L0U8_TUPCH|nr:hypothetical protein TREES_T100008848 [Tupaia chinensis]
MVRLFFLLTANRQVACLSCICGRKLQSPEITVILTQIHAIGSMVCKDHVLNATELNIYLPQMPFCWLSFGSLVNREESKMMETSSPSVQGFQKEASPFLLQERDLENHQATAKESVGNGEAFGSKGLWDSKAAA